MPRTPSDPSQDAMAEAIGHLAHYYGTTPQGLLEGLITLEWSLVYQELREWEQASVAPPHKSRVVDAHKSKSPVIGFAREQGRPFTTSMVSRNTGLSPEKVVEELDAFNWPSITREEVTAKLWLPLL